jgi:predicted transcriptional regulator of viral defense system/tetratricopeptide (TPR) repeat protein
MNPVKYRELVKLSEKIKKASAAVAYGSALRIHDAGKDFFSTQDEQITLYVQTPKRLRPFKSDFFDVRFISVKKERIYDIEDLEFSCNDKSVSVPVTSYEKSIIDSIEKTSLGPGIKKLILILRKLENPALCSVLEKSICFSSKACLKRLSWITDRLLFDETRHPDDISSILEKAHRHIGSGFTLLDTAFPDQGEYDQKWKVRLNALSLSSGSSPKTESTGLSGADRIAGTAELGQTFSQNNSKSVFKKRYHIEEHERYIFSYPASSEDILLCEPVIRRIRKAEQGVVLVRAWPGKGKTSLLGYLKNHYFKNAAVFRIRPEHRVFQNFTSDLVKCLVNTGLTDAETPSYRTLGNPETAAVYIRRYLCMIQARTEKKKKTKKGVNIAERALFLDDIDLLPFDDKNFSSFFSELLIPDLADFRMICSSGSGIPACFLRLDAEKDLMIIHDSDLEFTDEQKKRFLKRLLNAEPSSELAQLVFEKCALNPGLVKHFCLNDPALSLANIAEKTGKKDYTDPVVHDYMLLCLETAAGPDMISTLERVIVTEYITHETIESALEILCSKQDRKRQLTEKIWKTLEKTPFIKRVSANLLRSEPALYRGNALKQAQTDKEKFSRFLTQTGLIYSRLARAGEADDRINWAARAMKCFQKAENTDRAVELVRLYSDTLLKRGEIDLLESWLAPVSKENRLYTPVCYYMGIINHIKGLKGLAVSWFKKAEINELDAEEDKRDNSLLAMSLIMQGQLIREDDFEKAAVIYDRVIGLTDKIDDTYAKAVVKGSVGAFFESSRDDEMALAFYNSSLDELRHINEPGVEATVLNNIGLLLSRTDRIKESIDSYKEAIELYSRTRNLKAKSSTLYNLAHHYQIRGEYITAASLLNKCYDLRVSLNLHDKAAEAMTGLAYLHAVNNNFTHALKLIASVDEQLCLSAQRMLSMNLVKGCISSMFMDHMSAEEYCREAGSLISTISGNTTGYEWTLLILDARIQYLKGRLPKALEIIEGVLENHAFMKSPLRRAQASLFKLALEYELNDTDPESVLRQVMGIASPLTHEGIMLEPCPEFLVLLAGLFSLSSHDEKEEKDDSLPEKVQTPAIKRHLVQNRSNFSEKQGSQSFVKKMLFSYDPGVIRKRFRKLENINDELVEKILKTSEDFSNKNSCYSIISRFMEIHTSAPEASRLRKEYDSFELFIDMEKGICHEKKLGFVPLAKKAMLMRLLEYLVENKGSAISVEDIYENVWENSFYGDEDRQNVQMAVSRLRSLIEPEKDSARYILLAAAGGKTAYRFNSDTRHCLIIKR